MEDITKHLNKNYSEISTFWINNERVNHEEPLALRLLQSFYVFLNFCMNNDGTDLLKKFEMFPTIAMLQEYFDRGQEKPSNIDYLKKKCDECKKKRDFFLCAKKIDEINNNTKLKLCRCFGEHFEKELCLNCLASSIVDSLGRSAIIPALRLNEGFYIMCSFCNCEIDLSHLRIAMIEKEQESTRNESDTSALAQLDLPVYSFNDYDQSIFDTSSFVYDAHQEIVNRSDNALAYALDHQEPPPPPLPTNSSLSSIEKEELDNLKDRMKIIEKLIASRRGSKKRQRSVSSEDDDQDGSPPTETDGSSSSEEESQEQTDHTSSVTRDPNKRKYKCSLCNEEGHNILRCKIYCWKCYKSSKRKVRHQPSQCSQNVPSRKRKVMLKKKSLINKLYVINKLLKL